MRNSPSPRRSRKLATVGSVRAARTRSRSSGGRRGDERLAGERKVASARPQVVGDHEVVDDGLSQRLVVHVPGRPGLLVDEVPAAAVCKSAGSVLALGGRDLCRDFGEGGRDGPVVENPSHHMPFSSLIRTRASA